MAFPRSAALFVLVTLAVLASGVRSQSTPPVIIAGHAARFDSDGHLLPWIAWHTALEREMRFYESAPDEHAYPVFVTTTFLDGNWKSTRDDTIFDQDRDTEPVDPFPLSTDSPLPWSFCEFAYTRSQAIMWNIAHAHGAPAGPTRTYINLLNLPTTVSDKAIRNG